MKYIRGKIFRSSLSPFGSENVVASVGDVKKYKSCPVDLLISLCSVSDNFFAVSNPRSLESSQIFIEIKSIVGKSSVLFRFSYKWIIFTRLSHYVFLRLGGIIFSISAIQYKTNVARNYLKLEKPHRFLTVRFLCNFNLWL